VEDSPRIAERVRELLLQEEGVRVLDTVSDESSALRALTEQAVDVLILDLQLKVGTGFGVLEALGSQRPLTIVMTNYALPQYRERARQLGVDHFLNKAMEFERLSDIMAGMRASRDAAN
jgi:two-component system OmpR family response regulator